MNLVLVQTTNAKQQHHLQTHAIVMLHALVIAVLITVIKTLANALATLAAN